MNEEAFFQAIGVIQGVVNLNQDNQLIIEIASQKYRLFYAPQYRHAFRLLGRKAKNTQNSLQRLIVYPRVMHFPKRDDPHQLAFQVVNTDVGQPRQGTLQLEDMEFYLRGLWQFIPVCRTPCISVFRNFSPERLKYIKQAEPQQRANFLKASHLPLLWSDALVKPFRFNPKVPKEKQGKPVFVQAKVKFLPNRNLFGFDSLLGLPLEKPPNFLRLSKADKNAALKLKNSKNEVK